MRSSTEARTARRQCISAPSVRTGTGSSRSATTALASQPEFKEQIFGLFSRLHNADRYAGTGIGLAICQRIVERYHGRIWVESEPGRGSEFRFTLPV